MSPRFAGLLFLVGAAALGGCAAQDPGAEADDPGGGKADDIGSRTMYIDFLDTVYLQGDEYKDQAVITAVNASEVTIQGHRVVMSPGAKGAIAIRVDADGILNSFTSEMRFRLYVRPARTQQWTPVVLETVDDGGVFGPDTTHRIKDFVNVTWDPSQHVLDATFDSPINNETVNVQFAWPGLGDDLDWSAFAFPASNSISFKSFKAGEKFPYLFDVACNDGDCTRPAL
jgi:hypothetical protein